MQPNGICTPNHTVNFHFFVDASQIVLADIRNIYYLTCVNLFSRVNRGSNSLFYTPFNRLKKIGSKLCLANLAVLSLAEHLVHKDNEIVNFANLRCPFSIHSPSVRINALRRYFGALGCTLRLARLYPWFGAITLFVFDHGF